MIKFPQFNNLESLESFIITKKWGQNLERQNVERLIFRDFEISNIKITKVE